MSRLPLEGDVPKPLLDLCFILIYYNSYRATFFLQLPTSFLHYHYYDLVDVIYILHSASTPLPRIVEKRPGTQETELGLDSGYDTSSQISIPLVDPVLSLDIQRPLEPPIAPNIGIAQTASETLVALFDVHLDHWLLSVPPDLLRPPPHPLIAPSDTSRAQSTSGTPTTLPDDLKSPVQRTPEVPAAPIPPQRNPDERNDNRRLMISGIPTHSYNALSDKLKQLSKPRSVEYVGMGDNNEHRKHLQFWADLETAAETVRVSRDLKHLHGNGVWKVQHCAAAKKVRIEHDLAQFLFSQVAVVGRPRRPSLHGILAVPDAHTGLK